MIRVLFVNVVDCVSEVANRYKPLWPAYLAGYAEKKLGGHHFEFRYMMDGFAKELESFKPHIVALSSASQDFDTAKQYAIEAKSRNLSVLIGGFHITNMPHCLTEQMDVGCLGEGEETFVELLTHYARYGCFRRKSLNNIYGIVYRKQGHLIITPRRALIEPIDDIPRPKRALIGYHSHDYMFTSRGCPYQCVFCASVRYWKKVRYASAESVIAEISELVDNGVRMISFYDDNFVVNKIRLQQISSGIVADGLHKKVRFTCSARANNLTQEVIDMLKFMNVVSVGMGLESGCGRVLKYLKGNISVQDNLQAINLLKDSGIQANASFVIGSPDETEMEMMKTYKFIKTSRLDFPDIFLLTPYPGTPIWEYAVKRNLVSDDMNWSRLNINRIAIDPKTVIILSENITPEQMLSIYRKFRRLRLLRIIKALPGSPWIMDLPKVAWGMAKEKMVRLFGFCKQPYSCRAF